MVNAPSGTTGTRIEYNPSIYMSIAAFTAVAWYNVAELNIQVFLTFKRHRGLYFWSLLISSWGCVLHALGFLLKFFQLTRNDYLSVTIITIGWYAMVTGQSVVLYSRLHLVVREQRVLRGILALIIIDAICFHIPTTVLTYGSNTPNPTPQFLEAFNVVEKLQMTMFCIQEFIISGVYVWATLSLLRPVYHGRTRKVMMQLIWINLIIIAMDVCLLVVEYLNWYEIEATLKAMVYSIKLKLEFAVLNQLMTLANSSVNNHQNLRIDEDNEKGVKGPPGRSRSTEYISNKYRKTSKRDKLRHRTSSGLHKSTSFSTTTNPAPASRPRESRNMNRNRFQWVPNLDRHTSFLDPKHIEHAQTQNPQLNVYTNPAACYKTGSGRRPPQGFPPHDGLGGIPDNSPIVSPTLTGTTIENPPPPPPPLPASAPRPAQQQQSSFRFSRRPAGAESHQRNTPPEEDDDDVDALGPPIMPSGLLRSTRPSVSDWAHGTESEPSPTSDEASLNPYDPSYANQPYSRRTSTSPNRSPKSSGSAQFAHHRSSSNKPLPSYPPVTREESGPGEPEYEKAGLDFMTSALATK